MEKLFLKKNGTKTVLLKNKRDEYHKMKWIRIKPILSDEDGSYVSKTEPVDIINLNDVEGISYFLIDYPESICREYMYKDSYYCVGMRIKINNKSLYLSIHSLRSIKQKVFHPDKDNSYFYSYSQRWWIDESRDDNLIIKLNLNSGFHGGIQFLEDSRDSVSLVLIDDLESNDDVIQKSFNEIKKELEDLNECYKYEEDGEEDW